MITYQVLSENILIIYQGQPFSIPKGDKRYDVVKQNLHDLKPEHFTLFNELPAGFKFIDGSLYFHKFPIPAKLEERFFSSPDKDSFVNFWANIVSRHDFETVCKISNLLEKDKIRPVSKDGFVLFKKEDVPDILHKDFVSTKMNIDSLESELNDSFPIDFFSKREFMIEIKNLCRLGLDTNYFSFLGKMIFGATLDETVSVLKAKPLLDHPEVFHDLTTEMVKNFIKNKSNTFSKTKFDTLMKYPLILKLISYHNMCREERIEFDFQDVSPSSALDMVTKQLDRLELQGFSLKIEENFPETKSLDGLVVLNNFKLSVPKFTKELVVWGSILNNCVGNGSYAIDCKNGKIYILGLLNSSDKIVASIEVQVEDSKNHRIIQFEENFGHKNYVKMGSSKWQSLQNEIDKAILDFSKVSKKHSDKI